VSDHSGYINGHQIVMDGGEWLKLKQVQPSRRPVGGGAVAGDETEEIAVIAVIARNRRNRRAKTFNTEEGREQRKWDKAAFLVKKSPLIFLCSAATSP